MQISKQFLVGAFLTSAFVYGVMAYEHESIVAGWMSGASFGSFLFLGIQVLKGE